MGLRSYITKRVVFAVVTLFHALVIASARFRIPLEPMTFVWAAAAVAPVLLRWMPGRRIKIYRPGQHPNDPFGPEHILQGLYRGLPERRRAG